MSVYRRCDAICNVWNIPLIADGQGRALGSGSIPDVLLRRKAILPQYIFLKIPYKIVRYFLDNSSIDKNKHMYWRVIK